MRVKRIGRTAPTEPDNGPTSNPDAEELAALRKEKADREAADREAREKELEELRRYKEEQESKAKVKAPARKTEAAPAAPPPPAAAQPKAKRRGRSGASRLWFGEDPDDA